MTLRSFYTRYSWLAGILYSLPVAAFFLARNYSNSWLLFVGNMLFGAVIFTAVIRSNHRIHDAGSLKSLFMTGIKLSFFALLIAIVITLLMIVLNAILANFATQDSPGNMGSDTQTDMIFSLLSHTLAGNAFMGVLASVLTSVTVKRNQKTEQGKTIY
jgi:hypothetical protein